MKKSFKSLKKKVGDTIISLFTNFTPLFFLPDPFYNRLRYFRKTGKFLNLKNPVTYDEKIQWHKIYNRQPHYPALADKYEVRKFVAETIGEKYLIPNFGVWNSFDEIPFDQLPEQFVLKCTHDCGSIRICKDKNSADLKKLRRFFRRRLLGNHYWQGREWVYKNIKPRIIAEKFMAEEAGDSLKDYKIFCFNGEPKIIVVTFGKYSNKKARNCYSPQWEYQPVSLKVKTAPDVIIEKPKCLDEMLDLSRKLSAGMIHVRVDFYIVGENIYFGELTFHNASGFSKFDPPEWNKTFGDWMVLPEY